VGNKIEERARDPRSLSWWCSLGGGEETVLGQRLRGVFHHWRRIRITEKAHL